MTEILAVNSKCSRLFLVFVLSYKVFTVVIFYEKRFFKQISITTNKVTVRAAGLLFKKAGSRLVGFIKNHDLVF